MGDSPASQILRIADIKSSEDGSPPPQYFLSKISFKLLLPLLGKEYVFPSISLDESAIPQLEDAYDSDDEDEQDRYFASKFVYYTNSCELAQYPDDINSKISGTDILTSNFDVVSFLSTEKRGYLFLNDGHDSPVGVGSLRDKKWVMICCFFCPNFSCNPDSLQCRAVSNVCYDLYAEYGDSFGMVLVLKMRKDFQADESAFRYMLSGFPSSCLVVPFSDSHSRDSICCSLGFSTHAKGLFVRVDDRKVIWHELLYRFKTYGVDAFPFTDEVFSKIRQHEQSEPWNCRSLENLFCCLSSMVLTKNTGGADSFERTSVEQLKEKLVGVYLCLTGHSIPMLQELRERCEAINIAFEVVVVYFPFHITNSDPYLFEWSINRALAKRNISWWVLPFKSWVSLRLQRLCKSDIEDGLIIVGKGVVDPNGGEFLREFERASRKVDGSKVKEEAIEKFKLKYRVSV